VRGSPANVSVVEMLKERVGRATPHIALFDVRTMAEEIGGSFEVLRLLAFILATIGLLGVVIAAIGLYGVIAYTVSQRTREFGVMKAVGGSNAHIYSMVVREGCRMMLLGIVPGLFMAELFVLFLRRFLPGIQAYDWATFLIVPGGLSLVGLIACILPIRRALRIEPYAALRQL
jgi:ABC-type antimicrobial peptide transport system permease subunit